MTSRPEGVAVIGAGIVGLSTATAIAARGEPVTVYEAGTPGTGQSAAESRLFRHAHDDIRMVELARASRAIWREWEQHFGIELISGDGALALGDTALERLEVLDRAGGLAASAVDGAEVARRLPLLAEYEGVAVFDPEAGAIRTQAAIAALAAELGDSLQTETGEVISLRPVAGGAEIRTIDSCARHSRVIVCAGRGTARLARGLGIELPIELGAHVRLRFAVREPDGKRLACLQDSSGRWGETGVYAAPLPGNDAYAVGLSETTAAAEDGALVDPDALASLADRTAAYVGQALPGLDPEPLGHLHCWVTELPWSADGLAAWESEGVLLLAGHNLFKQAPVLGRLLAEAALGDELDPRLLPASRLGA
jgi:sarcosine oxidase